VKKAKRKVKRQQNVLSAQDSIPFKKMMKSGICHVKGRYYTKTIEFHDINYTLLSNDDRNAVFSGWCEFLNSFDTSVTVQFSFVNTEFQKDSYMQYMDIPLKGDDFDSIREEYSEMLKKQVSKGSGGCTRRMYLTFGIEADSPKAAKLKTDRIENDILDSFKRIGVSAEILDGYRRLEAMHCILHINSPEPFRFSWDRLVLSGLSEKDFIAPSSFEFKSGSTFGMNGAIGRMSFLQILAPELNDRVLCDFLETENPVVVTLHIKSVEQVQAIKNVKRKLTDLDKSKIDEVRPDRALCSVA